MPIEPRLGTQGWAPAFSIAMIAPKTDGWTPEPPRAMPFSRVTIIARTTSVGCSGSTPAAWLRRMCRWNAAWSASGIRASFSSPRLVVSP